MPRGYPFEGKTDVRVTHTATRDLHHDFVRTWFELRKRTRLQGALWSLQLVAVRSGYATHGGPAMLRFFL